MELVADRSYLGTPDPTPRRIGPPDGRVAPQFDVLADLLDEIHSFHDFCLVLWARHGHPDHDAGRRDTISTGPDRLKYVVWARLWARPPDPWTECRQLKWPRRVPAQKRWFTSAFASQIRPFGLDHADHPLLRAPILRRFWRTFEVFALGGSNK
jgi:hypothetical protein